MLVVLDGNPLHIHPGRRRVPATKRILNLDDASGGLAHPAGEHVARLVKGNVTGRCLPRIIWHRYDQALTLGRSRASSWSHDD